MGCINVREGNAAVSLIYLDGCGAPRTGTANALLATDRIAEFGWEDQVSEGDEVTERNLGGVKYYSDSGRDELTHIAVNATSGGINAALDSLLMASALKLAEGEVRGYGRRDLDPTQNVAIEVLMQLDTDACTGEGAAPIAGWLFPLTKNWRPSGGSTLNGADLVKPAYQGKAYKNANLFTEAVEIPAALAKWEDVFDPADWYTFYVFDGSSVTLPSLDCDPVALVSSES